MPGVTPPVFAVGADPGQHAGLALVQHVDGARPRLVRAWAIHGSTYAPWTRRARAAAVELVSAIETLGAAPSDVRGWIEEPPPAVRKGALGGASRAESAWAGIGRRQEGIRGAVWTASQERLELLRVDNADWTWTLGGGDRGVAKAKWGDGTHRIREAGWHLEGAADELAAIPAACRIDVAEACLIALACLRNARGERAYTGMSPSERRRHYAQARRAQG